jgi:hypothetical protein
VKAGYSSNSVALMKPSCTHRSSHRAQAREQSRRAPSLGAYLPGRPIITPSRAASTTSPTFTKFAGTRTITSPRRHLARMTLGQRGQPRADLLLPSVLGAFLACSARSWRTATGASRGADLRNSHRIRTIYKGTGSASASAAARRIRVRARHYCAAPDCGPCDRRIRRPRAPAAGLRRGR